MKYSTYTVCGSINMAAILPITWMVCSKCGNSWWKEALSCLVCLAKICVICMTVIHNSLCVFRFTPLYLKEDCRPDPPALYYCHWVKCIDCSCRAEWRWSVVVFLLLWWMTMWFLLLVLWHSCAIETFYLCGPSCLVKPSLVCLHYCNYIIVFPCP